jgi:hypothetical protein
LFDPALRAELLKRAEEDQRTRKSWLYGECEKALSRMQYCDAQNATWLSALLARQGWPTTSLVRAEGERAAWLLVQHADTDIVLQRQALELLIEAVDAGEAPRWQVAFLHDRVARNLRRKQRYGTQYRTEPSGLVLYPSEEPEKLQERRTAMGLPASQPEYLTVEGSLTLLAFLPPD